MNKILTEAARLHKLGFGVHWLKPHTKVPVKSGWTTGERESFKELKRTFNEKNNIGTKLGTPSKVGDYYLAVIDVDVKGQLKKHEHAAKAWLEEHFPGLLSNTAITASGRGNGSMHVWLLVEKPLESKQLVSSSEEVEVFMPSTKPTQYQVEKLGQEKVDKGYRLRPAFEIDFMCEGRQVVLPPSIHPDTKKPYKWKTPLEDVSSLQYVEDLEERLAGISTVKKASAGRPKGSANKTQFDIVDVEESELELRLEPRVVSIIFEGDDVSDRSAAMLTVSLAMVRAQFEDSEILGVLTNRDFFIGDVAFQHAQTTNRQRAARWAYDYSIRKARSEADARVVFDCDVKVYDTLDTEAAKEQAQRIVDKVESDPDTRDWKKYLDRIDGGRLQSSMKNCVLILENTIAKNVFVRDAFSNRDTYGVDTPWGGRKGEDLRDDDNVIIKMWFANTWKFEPSANTVFEAMIEICNRNLYHPVRDYLNSLEWDGVSRVDEWLGTYLGADMPEPYQSEVGRKFLIAAVARVFEPGRKFDSMPVIEGLQGIGKSTVGRILAGEAWFLDSLPDLQDKDAALGLQGIWLCEMGELANIKRTDTETVKAFVSRQVDKVRPPYGKRYIVSARQCVFFGTTNSDDYLKDKTGNRRFWPVKSEAVDLDALKRDRDQLWAEAMFLYDLWNENLYLEGEAKAQAEEIQASRVVEDVQDVMFDILSKWWTELMKRRKERAAQKGKPMPRFKFQTKELFEDFASVEAGGSPPLKDFKQDNYHIQLASNALRKIGLRKIKVDGRMFWRHADENFINQYH